jgi:hypothetical protein
MPTPDNRSHSAREADYITHYDFLIPRDPNVTCLSKMPVRLTVEQSEKINVVAGPQIRCQMRKE